MGFIMGLGFLMWILEEPLEEYFNSKIKNKNGKE